MIKNGNQYVGMQIKGHAEYEEHGKDIVCAGVSTMYFACINAFKYVVDAKYTISKYETNEKKILLKKKNKTASIIFKVAYLTFLDLMTRYPSNVNVTVTQIKNEEGGKNENKM